MNEPMLYFEGIIQNKVYPSLRIKSFDFKELDNLEIPQNHFLPIGITVPLGLKIKQNEDISNEKDPILWINLVDRDF